MAGEHTSETGEIEKIVVFLQDGLVALPVSRNTIHFGSFCLMLVWLDIIKYTVTTPEWFEKL